MRNAAAQEAKPVPWSRAAGGLALLIAAQFLLSGFLGWSVFVSGFVCFAGPRLSDEGRRVLDNTTMGTTAAACERPAHDSQAASGCSFVFTHVGQLRVPASFSAPLFST